MGAAALTLWDWSTAIHSALPLHQPLDLRRLPAVGHRDHPKA
jgi:hypothetical protein